MLCTCLLNGRHERRELDQVEHGDLVRGRGRRFKRERDEGEVRVRLAKLQIDEEYALQRGEQSDCKEASKVMRLSDARVGSDGC
eukprot:2920796-Pleurochrysis_carterae.AAC.1